MSSKADPNLLEEAMPDQSFATHRKFVPGYHYLTLGILTINLLWSVYRVFKPFEPAAPIFDRLLAVLAAVAPGLIARYLPALPLPVPDRRHSVAARTRPGRLLT